MGEQWFTVICYLNVGFAFHWWNLFQTKNHVILEAEQLSSEDDDDDDDDDDDNEVDFPSDDDDDDDDDDDLDSSSGSEEIPEASGQVQQLTIQEEDGEELESEQEQEPDRIKIHEWVEMNELPVIRSLSLRKDF